MADLGVKTLKDFTNKDFDQSKINTNIFGGDIDDIVADSDDEFDNNNGAKQNNDKTQSASDSEQTSQESIGSMELNIPMTKVINNPKEAVKQTEEIKDTNQTRMILKINELVEVLERDSVEIPKKLLDKCKRPGDYPLLLGEMLSALTQIRENSQLSEYLTSATINFSNIAAMLFNGTRNVPFTNFKLNLTGWPQMLKRNAENMNSEYKPIAASINSKVPRWIIRAFRLFSVFGTPLIRVLVNNHGPAGMRDFESRDDLGESEDGSQDGDSSSEFETSTSSE
jgi:hypothetical protein